MKPRRFQAVVSWLMGKTTFALETFPSFSRYRIVAVLLLGLAAGSNSPAQLLQFVQPTNGAVYSMTDEIPIVLRASMPDDVIFSADVFANFHDKIGTALYCCPVCLCVRPEPGQETILQLPASYNGVPPGRIWGGWTNVSAGEYELTAKAVSEKGASVEATPVNITVLDRTLHIGRNTDGTIVLSIAMGAMVRGGYDLEISKDLATWTRLGPFSPGNVAAFYWDRPPEDARVRFYRSVYVPPPVR